MKRTSKRYETIPDNVEKPKVINSKAALEVFYWYTGTKESTDEDHDLIGLLGKNVKYQLIMEKVNEPNEYWKYKIMFPRCKYPAYAYYYNFELYRIQM